VFALDLAESDALDEAALKNRLEVDTFDSSETFSEPIVRSNWAPWSIALFRDRALNPLRVATSREAKSQRRIN
jgi:hypothetical protein